MRSKKGFTLIEIVVVIVLTSILIVFITSTLSKIRLTEVKIEKKTSFDKELYLLYNSLSSLIKNVSSFFLFNNGIRTNYFLGKDNEITFLSKYPIIFPYRSKHFIKIFFRKGKLLYKEKKIQGKLLNVTFEELNEVETFTLIENITKVEFSYFTFNKVLKKYVWKNYLNTFEKDILPQKILIKLYHKEAEYKFTFNCILRDKNEKIPLQFYK